MARKFGFALEKCANHFISHVSNQYSVPNQMGGSVEIRGTPKVNSGVIKMTLRDKPMIQSDYLQFKKVVKTAFNQRRKTLRNSLKSIVINKSFLQEDIFNLRPEQISIEAFDQLTLDIHK